MASVPIRKLQVWLCCDCDEAIYGTETQAVRHFSDAQCFDHWLYEFSVTTQLSTDRWIEGKGNGEWSLRTDADQKHAVANLSQAKVEQAFMPHDWYATISFPDSNQLFHLAATAQPSRKQLADWLAHTDLTELFPDTKFSCKLKNSNSRRTAVKT